VERRVNDYDRTAARDLYQMTVAWFSVLEASTLLGMVLHGKAGPLEDRTKSALIRHAVLAYAQPFSAWSNLPRMSVPKRLYDEGQRELHKRVVRARNTLVAHRDPEHHMIQFSISGHGDASEWMPMLGTSKVLDDDELDPFHAMVVRLATKWDIDIHAAAEDLLGPATDGGDFVLDFEPHPVRMRRLR
jgi:hypothetical protein